ncbi:MAG: PilZ domain-containing protein [Alphaproteobacteria bacterium]|nr:PilZ domain-containing protein [Alphaproteobacteria bacterium]
MRHGSNGSSAAATGSERRRHRRSPMKLNVRFLLDDGSEHSGSVGNISVGGMAIKSEARPAAGSSVIAYVQELGRLEGLVSRIDDDGFAVRLTLSAMRRDKLEERLGAGAKKGPEARKFHRETTEGVTRIQRADGRELSCRVIDLSLGGVSVETAEWPPLGEQVIVGKMRGRVVRHHEAGIAIEFSEIPPSRGSLAEQLMSSERTAA